MTRILLPTGIVAAALAALTVLTTSPAPSSRSSAAVAARPDAAARADAASRSRATRPQRRTAAAPLPVADDAVVTPEDAPPPPPLPQTAAEERTLIRQRLDQSGSTADDWSRAASAAIDTVVTELGADGVQFGPTECFNGGCIVAVTYADLSAYDQAASVFSDHQSLQEWSRAVTGPEVADARVTSALVLFPPNPDDLATSNL